MLPIKRGNTRMIPAKEFLSEIENEGSEKKSDLLKQLKNLLSKLSPEQLEEALNMVSDKMDNVPEKKEGENNGEEEVQGKGEEAVESNETMEG